MSETRYDWPVDRRPTQVRYTVLGDVTGSIQISMDFKPTFTAEERGALTITFVNMAANRTLLRSVPGIDGDNPLTKSLGFIPDKLFQFKERPVIEFPVELSTSTFLNADLCQVFKGECGEIGVDNLLRDAMVNISHKPSFSTGDLMEFPGSGSSAFGLEISTKFRVLRSNLLNRFRVEKPVIRTDRDVDNTPVDTENRLFRHVLRGICFKLAVQVKRIVVFAKRQGRGFNFPCQVLPVIFRNTKRGFDPTIGGCDCCIPRSQKHVDNPGIVSHCRILFTERFKLTLHRFQRFTSDISCALYQRGREIRYRLSNIVIGSIMAVNLADRMGFKTPCRTDVKCHGIISHGFQERVTGIRRNIKFQLNCPNHTHILVGLEYILNGGDADALLPTVNSGVSALLLR